MLWIRITAVLLCIAATGGALAEEKSYGLAGCGMGSMVIMPEGSQT